MFHLIVRHYRLPQVQRAPVLSAYLIGSLAVFWVFERTLAFFP
jgi:hypothetical protein